MDNMYPPPGGQPQDPGPAQPTPPQPTPGHPTPGQPTAAAPGTPGPVTGIRPPGRHLGRALGLSAGVALAAVLIGGGVIAASDLSSGPAAASAPTGQAAQLNALLSSADSPASAAGAANFATAGTPATAPVTRCRRAAARLRAAGHPQAATAVRTACPRLRRLRRTGGEYGQFTFRAKSGTKTLAFERGTVESAGASSVVVKAADGTTETWQLTSTTVVRSGGQKVAASKLASGDQVFVGGPVVNGARDARLAVIRPASPAPTGSSGSPASGS
jgi:hypothetical protein